MKQNVEVLDLPSLVKTQCLSADVTSFLLDNSGFTMLLPVAPHFGHFK